VDTPTAPLDPRDWHFVVADHQCNTTDVLSFPHESRPPQVVPRRRAGRGAPVGNLVVLTKEESPAGASRRGWLCSATLRVSDPRKNPGRSDADQPARRRHRLGRGGGRGRAARGLGHRALSRRPGPGLRPGPLADPRRGPARAARLGDRPPGRPIVVGNLIQRGRPEAERSHMGSAMPWSAQAVDFFSRALPSRGAGPGAAHPYGGRLTAGPADAPTRTCH